MMETFRQMVNECIRIGLENNCSALKRLSTLSYPTLTKYPIQSKYKLTAISQACGRLGQMKRDIKKGRNPKSPYVHKPYLVSCYGFKINGMLLSIPMGNKDKSLVMLNSHTVSELKGAEPRSFTITPHSLSISIQKQVNEIEPKSVIGIDRNLRNVTISTQQQLIMYKTGKLLSIKENTMHVRHLFAEMIDESKASFILKRKTGDQDEYNNSFIKYLKILYQEQCSQVL